VPTTVGYIGGKRSQISPTNPTMQLDHERCLYVLLDRNGLSAKMLIDSSNYKPPRL
jgi:hypothetical protein